MAALSDSEKKSLKSIYTLEFYKTKKNWKLSKDVRKESPPTPKTTDELKNDTQSKREQVTPVIERELVIPEIERELVTPEIERELVTPDTRKALHEEPVAAPSGVRAEALWQNAQLPAPQPHHNLYWQDRCGLEAATIPKELADDQCITEAAGHSAVLTFHEKCDTEATGHPEELTFNEKCDTGTAASSEELLSDQISLESAVLSEQLALDAEAALFFEELAYDLCDPVECTTGGDITPAQRQALVEEWLQLHEQPLYQKKLASSEKYEGLPEFEPLFQPPTSPALSWPPESIPQFMSEEVNESANFMRGAHKALHSSDTDLSVNKVLRCVSKCPGLMTAAQLERAIQRHQHTLSLLLEEAAHRDRKRFKEECMVSGDTNPLRPGDLPSGSGGLPSGSGGLPSGSGGLPSGSGCLQSGSGGLPSGSGDTGRGRGRLQQARKNINNNTNYKTI